MGRVSERTLVTGAYGCIGAWVVHELVRHGREVVTFDLSTEPRRLRLLLGNDVDSVPHVAGDITDGASVEHALDEHGITKVIHLAALQVPFVRADPPLGARVNVLGTVNVFEAAKRRELAPIVYASSIAAIDVDSIGYDDVVLPFPEVTDASSFRALVPGFADTPLDQGVALTVTRFRELLAEGLVTAP